ncbi:MULTISPECIES: ATP-binding protein [unclassified Acinetobacter]|uniref:ATP-binding protein n=1 Tax=unclassified Acinetobacter TaxID=196816 RepID=UPI0035B8A502
MVKHSIFVRIYAGLVGLVMLVAILTYFIVQLINAQRAQDYRESMADGLAYVVSQVVAKQPTPQAQKDWIADVSRVMELPIDFVSDENLNPSRGERRRLDQNRAVVRYDDQQAIGEIYTRVEGIENSYLHIHVDKLTEAQIKMIPILVLEDLMYYQGSEQQRLKELENYFPYPIGFRQLSDLKLDVDQISRLRTDKTQTLLIYRDSATLQGTTISAISAYTNVPNQVLVLGPVPVFNWFPFRMFAGIVLFSLFMLSLGVYILMRPLQRKIRGVRTALNQVRQGDMNTRVEVDGKDEVANLGLSFNMMTEHIQRLIEAQRELTRAVSHELRTPVARIRFGVEMLTDYDDYDDRVEQMNAIDKDIESLNSLIDEILTYATLEQGTPSLNFEKIVLKDVLQQVLNETDVIKKDKTILELLPDDNQIVEAEYRYLHRVIQNFVGNALRYCNHSIQVSGGIENGMAYICVEDDGAGIPEKDRDKVFEAFARLDDSRTRASGGYGLGLSIVSRIAYWFGGSAKVDQSPSLGGARFIMRWPAKRTNNEPEKSTKEQKNKA